MSTLNVLLDPRKTPGIIAAKLLLRGGSSADPFNQRGAHQLLGSLLSRGCGPYDNIALGDLVEGCGAGLRCDINEDGILISLKCAKSDAKRLLPLLGWMVIEPHLETDQIKLERELSLQALHRQKENPFQIAFDGWRCNAYGNTPYGHDPLGFKEELSKLKRKQLKPLANELQFTSSVLTLSGSLNEDFANQVKSLDPFPSWPNVKKENELKEISLNNSLFNLTVKNQTRISLHPEETEQVFILMGQPTVPHGTKEDLPLRLLGCYIGSGMSSVLFKCLREDHGVAYDVGVHHPIRHGPAPFVIHASTSEDKALLSLKLLSEIWWNLTSKKINEQNLELARSKFRGQLAHSNQTCAQRAERMAQLKLLGLSNDFDAQTLKAIEQLGTRDLQNAAKKYLQKPFLSLCGPPKTLETLSNYWSTMI